MNHPQHKAPAKVNGFHFMPGGEAVKVFFESDKPPLVIHLPLVKQAVSNENGYIYTTSHIIHPDGSLTRCMTRIDFEDYMQHLFEEEAIPVLELIIHSLKL